MDDIRTEPMPPPYRVGDRIKYVGTTTFNFGTNPSVRPGDVGRVVANIEGSVGRPDLGPEFAQADDGWSTVEINGNLIAVRFDWTDRYVRVHK